MASVNQIGGMGPWALGAYPLAKVWGRAAQISELDHVMNEQENILRSKVLTFPVPVVYR